MLSELVQQLDHSRTAQGLSARALARAAGCSPATSTAVLAGRVRPQFGLLARLGSVVGLRLELTPATARPSSGRVRRPTLPQHPAHEGRYLHALAGAELRWVRRARGWTTSQAAETSGLSERAVRRVELPGDQDVCVGSVARYASVVGYRLAWNRSTSRWRTRPWQEPGTPRPPRGGWERSLLSSARRDWGTPPDLLARLCAEGWCFTLDAAAHTGNHVVADWLGPDHPDPARRDALAFDDWVDLTPQPGAVWLNPPYGRGMDDWLSRAAATAARGSSVVCLVPARTDTGWWHTWASVADVELLRGRLRFVGAATSAPFPSALLYFRA